VRGATCPGGQIGGQVEVTAQRLSGCQLAPGTEQLARAWFRNRPFRVTLCGAEGVVVCGLAPGISGDYHRPLCGRSLSRVLPSFEPCPCPAVFRMLAHEVTKREGGCERFAQKLAQKLGRNNHCIRQFIIGKGISVMAALNQATCPLAHHEVGKWLFDSPERTGGRARLPNWQPDTPPHDGGQSPGRTAGPKVRTGRNLPGIPSFPTAPRAVLGRTPGETGEVAAIIGASIALRPRGRATGGRNGYAGIP
jgi:hypothetical protein